MDLVRSNVQPRSISPPTQPIEVGNGRNEEQDYLVPISGKHILKIALRVKELIDSLIPIQFDPEIISKPDSPIITEKIYELVLEAAGGQGNGEAGSSSRRYRATLIFVLLVCKRWYYKMSKNFLYDAELFEARALATEYIAKKIIEREEDEYYLFKHMLCQRYTITLYGRDVHPANALELAVDQHATIVIGSSGYQRCMKWLWRGWIIQSDADPTEYVFYKRVEDTRIMAHFDPDRIKTPRYQNYILLMFSFVYLGIYTLAINDVADSTKREFVRVFEGAFYVFTSAFLLDEIQKLYEVGLAYFGFWNAFNDTLYVLVVIAAVLRVWGNQYEMAYRFLACCAPLVWGRLLLYLDSVRFFGAMLVVLKELMKESLIFFVLLAIIAGGFLQAFIGLDEIDGVLDVTQTVLGVMTRTLLDSPEFEFFEEKLGPFGVSLYYVFTFLISTILLNILIALFNSAYEKIYDNATDEYMALVAQKTLRFVRAPDEHVFVPPLNILETLFLIVPLKWWMDADTYIRINDIFMTIVYCPILFITAIDEARVARRVKYNRSKGVQDDANEDDEEWDLFDGFYGDDQLDDNPNHRYGAQYEQMERVITQGDPQFHIDEDKWRAAVLDASPHVSEGDKSGVGWENYELLQRIENLTKLVNELIEEKRDRENKKPSTSDESDK